MVLACSGLYLPSRHLRQIRKGQGMKPYEPELGQGLFGCPCGQFEAPAYVVAALTHIAEVIQLVEANRRQEPCENPMENSGENYVNDVFEAHSYWWGADGAPGALRANFKCGDMEVRWYKNLWRGATVNRDTTPDEWADILDRCLASLSAQDDANMKERGVR